MIDEREIEMSLKKWSYIILFSGIINLIIILLTPINIVFGVIGMMGMLILILISHITCRCPKCDVFLNAGIIFEASRKKRYCPRCGNIISTDKKLKL